MKFLRSLLEKQSKHFHEGGKLKKFFPLWEATETFLYTPGKVTRTAPHVRDAADLKRVMITVLYALIPCILMAMYNTGLQAHLAVQGGAQPLADWQTSVYAALGFDVASTSILACFVHGALYFLPVYVVTIIVGGAFETLFAMVRKHEINEGFLVTSILFPLILPPTIPLWQVALGIAFGVVLGKEVFGGVGRNIWNPALTARVFLYFAYPAQISGDAVWIAARTSADGYSGATWLAAAKSHGLPGLEEGVQHLTNGALQFWDAFMGFMPGSMGETSTICCLLGAAFLILTRVASWRVMAGVLAGSFVTVKIFNFVGPEANPMFGVPFHWHLVLGGMAFATVFMATDPVSGAYTDTGRWIYGGLLGALAILVREVNPAFAESWMLAILFMNTFSPLIDFYVVRANVKRRLARYET